MVFIGSAPTPKEERRRQGFGTAGPLKELDTITMRRDKTAHADISFRVSVGCRRECARSAHFPKSSITREISPTPAGQIGRSQAERKPGKAGEKPKNFAFSPLHTREPRRLLMAGRPRKSRAPREDPPRDSRDGLSSSRDRPRRRIEVDFAQDSFRIGADGSKLRRRG